MTIAFYIVAGLTAVIFLGAGGIKLARPKSALTESGMTWVEDFSPTSVKLIGLAEALGAVGLIVPTATNIMPVLSPIAGIGLVIVMIGAAIVHTRRKEPATTPLGLAVLPLAATILGFLSIV